MSAQDIYRLLIDLWCDQHGVECSSLVIQKKNEEKQEEIVEAG